MKLTKVATMLLACTEGTQLNADSESTMYHSHSADKLEAINEKEFKLSQSVATAF